MANQPLQAIVLATPKAPPQQKIGTTSLIEKKCEVIPNLFGSLQVPTNIAKTPTL